MHDDHRLVEARLERALRQRLRPALYGATVPLDIEVWHAPGEPVPVSDALAADYKPASLGETWGPPWGDQLVPPDRPGTAGLGRPAGRGRGRPRASEAGRASRRRARLHDRGRADQGPQPRQHLHPARRARARAVPRTRPTRTPRAAPPFHFYVEAAANPTSSAGRLLAHPARRPGDRRRPTRSTTSAGPTSRCSTSTSGSSCSTSRSSTSCAASCRRPAPRARRSFAALGTRARRARPTTTSPGRPPRRAGELAPVLAKPAYASAHQISAVGHAHIDSAWLWPLRETVRKVARTVSNVTALAADNPDFMFAFSSAQQHAWMKDHHPQGVGAAQGRGRGRPVRPGRRHVGRVRHQHAGRRGDGPPVRPRQAVLPRRVRHRDRGGLAAGLLRLLRRAPADRQAVRPRSGS